MPNEPHLKGPYLTALTPRQVARDLGLPVQFVRRRRRHANIAPSWDTVLDWAVDAYWERQGHHDEAA